MSPLLLVLCALLFLQVCLFVHTPKKKTSQKYAKSISLPNLQVHAQLDPSIVASLFFLQSYGRNNRIRRCRFSYWQRNPAICRVRPQNNNLLPLLLLLQPPTPAPAPAALP